jgi:imidazolonepropionase
VTLLTGIGRLFTAGPDGVIEDAAVVVDGPTIAWVGRAADAPPTDDRVDLGGALVTPGLVDAHTHPVYAGNRFGEIAARSAGATYTEIAAAGGGIAATVLATRDAAPAALAATVAERLRAWPRHGTTTVETKTGYHLDRAGELAAVDLLASLRDRPGLPDLAVTFLAAHGVPPGMAADEYIDAAAGWSSAAAAGGATACDVFCDEGYFTVDQARRILDAGRAAGLAARIHADELAHTGGAQLAAALGAASADHLLRVDAADIAALAAASVTAVLCPVTALALGVAPPARAMLDAGVTVALGTDHNPGTSGLTDMTVVIAIAVAALGFSVTEALTAATVGGARSLRLADRGVVAAGRRADLTAWDADHEGAFAWAWGVAPRSVWRAGERVFPAPR